MCLSLIFNSYSTLFRMQELPQSGGHCGKLLFIQDDWYLIHAHYLDLLWSDPESQVETWTISPRGGGYLFGPLPTTAVSK